MHYEMNQYYRSLLLTALLIVLSGNAFAQPDIKRDTSHYNDEELYNEDLMGGTPGYSYIGGGVILGMHLPSLTNFNSLIAQPFIHQNLKEQAFYVGGQGFMPFPFVKNLRIGGIGMSGSSSICCVSDTVTGQPVMRSLTYHVGYGALTLDYAVFNSNKFHILAGSEFGLGDVEIWAQQAVNRSTFDIASEFSSNTFNITHNYHAGFFLLKPQVEFEYAPLKWLMARLAAGYQVTLMGTWKADADVSITDAAALGKVDGNGAFFHFGLFVGFF
jgi:hypothetical protein